MHEVDGVHGVRFGDVEVDFRAYTLTRGGRRHGLSRREMDLLRFFLRREGKTLDRMEIIANVWGDDEKPTLRTVDQHVMKLRKKIETDAGDPRHLITLHRVGYRFLRGGS